MSKLNKIIFLGRKSMAAKAAQFLLNKGIKISLIVAPLEESYPYSLKKFAGKNKIPLIHDDKELYQMIEDSDEKIRDIDLVISYLYWRRIRMPLIKLASRGCINFHPAPLPEYKGRAGYNTAILEGKTEYGVSVHFIDSEEFDIGPIIRVLRLPIDVQENVMTLVDKAQKKLFALFKQTIELFLSQQKIEITENKGGIYLTKDELEKSKIIDLENDSLEKINKKVRAFFFPPYHGANIEIQGQKFTLVNEEIMEYLAKILSRHLKG